MSPSMDTPWSVVGDQYRASQSPRPLSTGRSGHNAGEVSGAAAFRPGSPSRPACTSPATVAAGTEAGIGLLAASVSACLVCGGPSVPGDDVALCKPHGGLGPAWADFDEPAWLAGREAS